MHDQQREALGQLLAIATTAVPDGKFTKDLEALTARDSITYSVALESGEEAGVGGLLTARKKNLSSLTTVARVMNRPEPYSSLRSGLEAVAATNSDLITPQNVSGLYRAATMLTTVKADGQMGYSAVAVQHLGVDPQFQSEEETRHSNDLINVAISGTPGGLEHLGSSALEERRNDLAQDLEASNRNGQYAEFIAELDDNQVYRLMEEFLPTQE